MFRAYFGQCKLCPTGTTRLIVVKQGYCKPHNDQQKNIGKLLKPTKPKQPIKKKLKYGLCLECKTEEFKLLMASHLCKFHDAQKKKAEKSTRTIKLVNKSEKKQSIKYLKKELDRIFSLYIRWLGAKDGKNKCFTCDVILPIEKLQCGHYESRKYLSLRYEISNNSPQCPTCNIIKSGNYTVYALRMIEKYGKEHLDWLAIKKHNIVKWTAFEYQLMINEFSEKLKNLQNGTT